MPCAERMQTTFRLILRQKWNSLRSPACPYNYLHGKVRPIGVDDNGDLVFRYTEHDYETRWKAEGIDLTV
jgi:hypothetical protein